MFKHHYLIVFKHKYFRKISHIQKKDNDKYD